MFPVSTIGLDEPGREYGGRYLDMQLTRIGLGGRGANAELSRLTGLGESMISKWRRGKATPSVANLRTLLSAVESRARQLDVSWETSEFFVRFGLIQRDDMAQEPIHPLFVELVQLDREAGLVDEFEQQVLRRHIQMLVEGTRRTLEEKRATRPGTGRKAS